jgi:hypothetical protein
MVTSIHDLPNQQIVTLPAVISLSLSADFSAPCLTNSKGREEATGFNRLTG